MCNTEVQLTEAFTQFEMSDRCIEISQKATPELNFTRRGDVARDPIPEVLLPRDGQVLAAKGDRAESRIPEPALPRPATRSEPSAPRKVNAHDADPDDSVSPGSWNKLPSAAPTGSERSSPAREPAPGASPPSSHRALSMALEGESKALLALALEESTMTTDEKRHQMAKAIEVDKMCPETMAALFEEE